MMHPAPRIPRRLPGSVLVRHLIRELLGFLVPILIGFVILYLIIDLFERLNILLKNDATFSAAVRYFVFKIPLMITQILPPAVVVSVLFTFGMAGRRNEITALRAGGISLWQSSLPILGLAALISILALVWNETVVPPCTRYYQEVNLIEIRKRERRSLLNQRETWYHGARGFYNISYIDSQKETLYGVAIYQVDSEFRLDRVVHIGRAQWSGNQWELTDISEKKEGPDREVTSRDLRATEYTLPERFEDFLEVQREPEEMSYSELRNRIDGLQQKGIDASNLFVNLHLKLSIPFASFILACVAAPLAGKVRRHPSLAAIIGAGAAIGFGYWVILGLCKSLGESGVLPAPVAAWSANALYGLLAFALYLRSE